MSSSEPAGAPAELTLRAEVTEADIPRLLGRAAQNLQLGTPELTYHPFAGFRFAVPAPFGATATVHVLVDRYSGKAFLTDRWRTAPPAPREQRVSDPGWNSVDLPEARQRAVALVRTARLKRAKLAARKEIALEATFEQVWKPNWLVRATVNGAPVEILVDALSGRFYVI